ncbi:VOC family protein [Xanthobacteraceae bacterium A53D]
MTATSSSSATGSSLAMGKVVLTVNDLDQVSAFYERAVGLHRLKGDGESVELGVGGTTLLELRRDASARRRTNKEAGLFHTAFLLPTRADLARWTHHAIDSHTPVTGASDHAVSEAIYLADPEGNGVEIYADRPAAEWVWQDGLVQMGTEELDFENLLAIAPAGAWQGFPEGSRVGHVHLQVGALPPAEAFYAGILGFDVTCRYPGGTFYAVDGYHHHLATNIWNSRGAPLRDFPATGLTEVVIEMGPERLAGIASRAAGKPAEGGTLVADPWGTPILLKGL